MSAAASCNFAANARCSAGSNTIAARTIFRTINNKKIRPPALTEARNVPHRTSNSQ